MHVEIVIVRDFKVLNELVSLRRPDICCICYVIF